MRAFALAALFLALSPAHGVALPAEAADAAPAIHVGAQGSVRVDGLFASDADIGARAAAESLQAADWRAILRIVARDPDREVAAAELPPLLGRYELSDDVLRFTPRFPPAAGLVIEATFDLTRWKAVLGRDGTPLPPLEARRRIAEPEMAASTRVEALRPAGRVPANLLRIYVHFSAPMAARGVFSHVRLVNDGGEEVPLAFVEVPGGLWNGDRTRLTLFVHPGRVKRGVGPNQVLGPVLESGRTYRLQIGADARDARGRPLTEPFDHALTVGPEDHRSPDPRSWTLEPPRTVREDLRIRLFEPADVALLERLLLVVREGGETVPGRFDAAPDGRSVRFRPTEPWTAGSHRLVVPVALEDAAGNRVDRRFEEKPSEAAEGPVPESVDVRFRVPI